MEFGKLYFHIYSVLLMMSCVFCSDGIEPIDEGRYIDPVKCFRCLSYSHRNNYCGDPFNSSHPDVISAKCLGQCVKWVREPIPGIYRYERACSEDLNILMTINLVCMEESRPSTGRICFCEKDGCNTAAANVTSHVLLLCFIIELLRFVVL